MRVLITTIPFGDKDSLPIEQLSGNGLSFDINHKEKKITEDELAGIIPNYDALIAGTEIISKKVIDQAKRLKIISRVGIGLDGLDLNYARSKSIKVTYTPEAPAPAVAELTMALILNCLRYVNISDSDIKSGHWHRHFGRRIPEVTIGIIGLGRIGTGVIKRLAGFGSRQILVNDIVTELNPIPNQKIEFASKEKIFRESDVVTLHIPLTKDTKNMVSERVLRTMKSDSILINTARGGIINELALHKVMSEGHLSAAAIDVFEQEPYKGPLTELKNIILTAHMGSMSVDCRTRMEIEAAQEIIRFHKGEILKTEVPEYEYDLQR